MEIIERQISKTGLPTLKVNNLYIHSKFDPVEEARRIAAKHYKKYHIHIVFGYGYGYIVDALLAQHNDTKIVVIDPLIEQQQLAIEPRHIEKVTYWDQTSANTLNFTLHQLGQQLDRKIQILLAPNYDKIFMAQYAILLKKIRNFQKKSTIGTNTEILFAKRWQQNLTYNLKHLIEDESLMALQHRFNLPIVIASGGPSLTKQLPLLKEIESHVLIIAAGSTINSLLAANIEPDFVVSIDGGEPNYLHFKDVQTTKTRLIYSSFNHYKIRDVFTTPAYAFLSTNEEALQQYIHKKFNKMLPRVSGSGTVAHFAYSVAHTIDSGPIAFIGQDLAYTDGQSHAKNNKHYKKMTSEDVKLIETDGYYDEPVLTSHVFMSFKTTFEEMVRFHEVNQPMFNCTEGGVKIQGMEQLPFQKFVESYVDKTVCKNLDILDEGVQQKKYESEQFVQVMQEELDIIDTLIKKCDEALQVLKGNRSNTTFSQKVLKKLNKIDRFIELKTKDIQIHFLIKPIYVEVETLYLERDNETSEQAFDRVKKQSQALYTKLNNALAIAKGNVESVIQMYQ